MNGPHKYALLFPSPSVAGVERRLSAMDELEPVVNFARATRLRQSVLQKAFASGPVSQ